MKAERWWLHVDAAGQSIDASDEPWDASVTPANGSELIEVIPASQLQGAVQAGREQWEAAHDEHCRPTRGEPCPLGKRCHWPIPDALRGQSDA